MKKALLKIIIAIIAVITLGITIYSFAADISTYMVIHDNQSYLTTSKSNKEKYIGKTVGIPGDGSDYNYVTNKPRVWCLSEGQINSTGSLLNVSGIIEIGKENNPTYTTIYSGEGTRENVRGESEVRRAQAAFTMFAGSDKNVDNISGIAQKHFYNTFKDELEDEGLEDFEDTSLGSDNSNKKLTHNGVTYSYYTYSTAITNLNKTLKDNTYKDLVNESYGIGKKDTHYKNGNEKYYYSCISSAVTENVLDFSSNSTLVTARKVIITSDSGTKTYTLKLENCNDCSKHWYLYNSDNQLSGRITMKGAIYLYEQEYKPGNNIKSVEIKVEFDYIHAILYMLGGTATQTRGVSLGEWLKGSFSSNTINITENKTEADISMQKYITKVESGENSQDFNDSRANARSSESETSDKHVTVSGSEKTYKNISKNNNVKENYKYNEKVSIEVGDKVTYRIYVYNNKNNSVSGITLTDRLPFYYTTDDTNFNTGAKATAVKVISVKDSDGKDVSYTTAEESDSKCELLTIQNITLNGNQEKYFDIVLEFNKFFAGVYTNSAWVSCEGNETDYRVVDRDYVEMQKYSVALEKFVSKVNDEPFSYEYEERYDIDGDGVIGQSDVTLVLNYAVGSTELSEAQKEKADLNGDGKINSSDALILIHEVERELHPTYNPGTFIKEDNPVRVELGDEVTYTIKLINTGETVIKVTEIIDVFNNEEIEYVDGTATGYGTPSVEKGEDGNLIIKISNPEPIEPGQSKYLTLNFKVKVSGDNLDEEQKFKNTATVTNIINKNDKPVTDSDGEENNTDSDWIKPKLYAVSLEKFISAVNGKEPTGDDGDREGKAEYLTLQPDGTYVNETNKDPMGAPNTYKKDHIVTVSKGNTVTYTIKVTNDGDASVYVSEIEDIFPSGVKYNDGESTVKFTNNPSESGAIYKKELENLLEPGESASFTVEVEVIADNSSMEVYKNTAKITKIQEKTKTIDITDSTPNDNEDSDYIDLNYDQPNPPDDETTSYSVEKIWSDKGNKAGKRPSSITVELHRVGEGKVEEVTLNASNGWKYKWENLKKYDESKNEYQYFVKETTKIDGYKTNYTIVGNKTIIENRYNDNTEQKIDITVIKKWVNDTVSTRPTSIKVQLYQDGNKYKSEVQLDESNSWSYTWEELDKSHTYTVKEVDVPEDYDVEYNGYTIYNTYNPKGEKTTHSVEKVWVDEDNKAGKRPESIEVELHRVGEGKVKEVTLNESNNWRYEWVGLDKYDENKNEYQYFVKEISKISGYKTYYTSEKNKTIIENRYNDNTEQKIDITVNKEWKNDTVATRPTSIKVQLYKDGNKYKSEVQLDESNKWSHTWEGLDKSHTYTVKEVDVPENYTVEYDGYTIYNIYNTDDIDEKTSYSVEKVWVDDNDKAGKRPESIEVELHRVGEGKIKEATLKASEGWRYEWTGLEKYDKSKNEYQYFVKETSNIDGYKTYYITEGNKTKIENRYNDNTEQKIDITVNKYWKNDTAATRPTTIKVQLYQDSNKYGAEVQLDGSNSWSHTWEGLDKSYTYTVKEVDIPENYTVEYDGYTIYNTYNSTPGPIEEDGVISGFVWNDIPLNKIQDNYNGLYDHGQENKIPGIKVYLYRTGVSFPVASETTDENGYYGFYDSDLTTDLPENQRYLKGPKDTANNRWTGEYYSYHIVFEYDGLTYTSTQYSTIDNLSSSERDSNAKEDLADRTAFNDKFTTIKYDGAYNSSGNKTTNIDYTTVNNSGYIPESKYVYNEETMIMKSSTELINMGEVSDYEEQLRYISLGIRGRDIFDLELTSDIREVEVKINNQKAVYKNTNNINIRKSDFKVDSQYEDMANTESEKEKELGNNEDYLQKYYQDVRDEDIAYLNEVYITQKITIHNASRTAGIVNCVDTYFWADELEVVSVKDANGNEIDKGPVQASNISGGARDKISFYPRKELKANEKTEIFVKYKLRFKFSESPVLYPIIIAEISEYKTVKDGTDNNEFTRGLIDKDSRPGSFDKEKVRLHEGEGSGIFDVTMVDTDLLNLKFEDDTYLNIVRFRKNEDKEFERTILGTVFEDLTKVEKTTRIKTGNGKLDENEVGIFGANVELIDSGNNVVATTSTDQNGRFSFSGFIPGEYTIRYRYGDTTNTVLLGQKEVEEGKYVNRYSYNGADYQSTNNYKEVVGVDEDGVAIETNILNTTENFWYLYNELEGISTATDFADRRDEIIDKVAAYNKESEITRLNDIRQYIIDANTSKIIGKINDEGKKDSSAEDGRTVEDINKVIADTNMFATTAKFLVTVEKPIIKEGTIVDSNTFGPYKIENMNFGLSKVPTTKLNLQKHISGFTIKDSTGSNTIAMAMDENGDWKFSEDEKKGDVVIPEEVGSNIDVSIEDEKLQGARLEITYQITKKTEIELDVDGSATSATTGLDIKGLVDLIDNNLSYNADLGSNSLYWDVITVDALKAELAATMEQYPNEFFELPATATKEQKNDKINNIIDDMKINNNTIVRLKDDSAFWKIGKGEATVPITLEKVLAPTSTLEELLTDVVDISAYGNTVRITNSDYKSGIKNDKGLTVLPGIQGDTVEAEILAIHPPTGESGINIVYLLIAIASLAILAAGVFGIKKFVIKK